MSSNMPGVDLALSLLTTRDLALERSEQPDDSYAQLAEVCASLRERITGDNVTGGVHSAQVDRPGLDGATAEQLRADLMTLSHDRSQERARQLTHRLRELDDQLRG